MAMTRRTRGRVWGKRRSMRWITFGLLVITSLCCATSQREHRNILDRSSISHAQNSANNPESSGHLESPQFLDQTESASVGEDPFLGESPVVTNVWFETDLRQVLIDISQETAIPIVWDKTVEGLVTYEAMDTPLTKVLEDILFSNGYVYVLRDSTYYVGSAGVESLSFNILSETRTLQLSNMKAEEAVKLLPDSFRPYVKATNTSNTVCVTAPTAVAGRIIRDLKAIDAPVPQIEIEAVVVEFSTSAIRKLGVDWSLNGMSGGKTKASLSVSTPEMGDAVLALDYLREAYKIGGKTADLAIALRAMADEGVAKIRATPQVRTLNGHTATLGITKEQYFFITPEEVGQYWGYWSRLETISSGIQLEITPYADSLGYITVNVKPQVDDVVGEGASGLPEISRRTANTTVRVKDGETITIGGLRVHDRKSVRRRVPILGSIPILGLLFGRTEKEVIESELVIFITPRVL